MRFFAVLNRDGGSLRTIDLHAFTSRMRETLETAGHSVDVEVVDGSELVPTLERASSSVADVVLAGGGDGTVSTFAGRFMGSSKALAILPAGTMNLFARGLGIPLDLEEAVSAFAGGEIKNVDIATANGRPFVHQFSIGMHARMVELRDDMDFSSRWGKLGASVRAAWRTAIDPPSIRVRLEVDGRQVVARATALGITNNLFGEGHLPYADRPDGGVLGIYLSMARRRSEMFWLVFGMARGKWRDNDQVEVYESARVLLTILSRRTRLPAAIDGELIPLQRLTEIRIHPGELKVLVPAAGAQAEAA